jgi:2-haloalkanoic acid dehalogenase type II
VVELPESTRTAAEAAQAVGCELHQIVKSLVFRGANSGGPFLILASGGNRVDETWMARYTGQPLARADPEFVRSNTGFAIGGVPPAGHPSRMPAFVDYDLLEFREVWAAAGHPQAVCRLTPRELLDLTEGRPVPVSRTTPTAVDRSSWVTFDCYGTLVDWRMGLLQQFKRFAEASTPLDENRLFAAYVREEMELEHGPYLPYRAVMAEALVRAARLEGLLLPPTRAAEAAESIPSWPVFPDTRRALTALRERRFRIAVLSNIEADLLKRTLDIVGVRTDCIVTAHEVRSYKPAFGHWIKFLKQTGSDPADVWHVSSSYEHDIEPARTLGFRTAFVERYGGAPKGKEVGLMARDLDELASQLLSLNVGQSPTSVA